jgi:hypothetical protein
VKAISYSTLSKNLFLHFNFAFLQNKVCADNSLPNFLYVFHDGFEVRGCIVRPSNEDVVDFPGARRRIKGSYGNKPVNLDQQDCFKSLSADDLLVIDGTKEVEAWCNFQFRFVSLHDSTDNCDVDVFGTDIVSG